MMFKMPDKLFFVSDMYEIWEYFGKITRKCSENFIEIVCKISRKKILELLRAFLKNLMGILNTFFLKYVKLSVIKI